jgi:hypothetical protein
MEFSLEGFLKSLSQKEIDELLTALDKLDPAAYEKRENKMKAVLGFDKPETSIHG